MDLERGVTVANPFAALGGKASNYCRFDGSRLVRVGDGDAPTPMTAFVHDHVLALASNTQFTCTGAKSVMRQRSYRFGLYGRLGDPASTGALAHDLHLYVKELPDIGGDFTTMIASFEDPPIGDEPTFERLLWSTLQQLHEFDAEYHAWAPGVSADPAAPDFSFSFSETPFFVIGLHAASSRVTRRLTWPTLVFNPHQQFDELKRQGMFERFRHVIREAERRLQGDINPMASDFGESSEAAQYSGRQVDGTWQCPFARKPAGTVKP